MTTQKNIKERSFEFSICIISLCRKLNAKKHYEISGQLLRCGTSIGANVSEAGAAQSKKDFIHKMSIASKEARETEYWLQLIVHSGIIDEDMTEHLTEIRSLVNILTRIVKTSRENEVQKNCEKT